MRGVMEFIDKNFMEAIEDLKLLSRIPSVSARGEGIGEAVATLSELFSKYGLRTKVLKTPGNPVIYAEDGDSEDVLLFYNHYDVQPPEPLEEWESPPFEPEIRDGKLFGRGVADNKGDIVSRLLAVRAIKEVMGSLPVKVKFLVEGEEEIGSPNLPKLIEEKRELLSADACIWESGGLTWDERPIIALGVKGILYVEIEAKGASVDLHSSYAPIIPNPAWELVYLLASLRGRDGRILIDGFYDDVIPPSPLDESLITKMPLEEDRLKESLGIGEFVGGLSGDELKKNYIFSPTCNICGIWSGYTGEGSKTVLPSRARVKLDFRLVPWQDPEDIAKKLKAHLERRGFSVEIKWWEGEKPARTPPDHPFVELVRRKAREVYGKEPVIYPSFAGTGPMHPFREILGLPVVCIGTGYPEARCHAPNENIRLGDFVLATKYIVSVILGFGEERWK